MTLLLDVNVLYCLHQTRHADFDAAQNWFAQRAKDSFATCVITQLGLLRLLCQARVGFDLFSLDEARSALAELTARPGHVFWADSPGYLEVTQRLSRRMQGHRQITDAYLLGLSIHKRGKLATLDRGILQLAGDEFASHVEFIGSPAAERRALR
jgi:uncharacterized protein